MSPRRPRALIAGAGLAVAALALTACSTSTPDTPSASTDLKPGGTVSLAYTMPDTFTKTMDAVVQNVDRAGVVTLDAKPIGNTYNDLTQRIVADTAAGTQADLALVPINRVKNMVEQGIAQPIDQLLTDTKVSLDALDPAAVALAKVDGKLYGVPFALSAPMLYFNAELFQRAGLDPNSPPKSWAEVRSAAEKLTALGDGTQGVVYQWDQDQWVFQSQVNSAGGSMLNDAGDKVAFDSAKGKRALEFWTGMAADGLFPPLTSTPNPDDQAAFTSGKLGMWIGSSAFAASVQSKVAFDVRTAEFPSETGDATPVASGGSVIMLLARDKQKQVNAAQVLAEFASPETSTALIQSTGYLPINKTARDSKDYLATFLADQPLRQPAINEISRLDPWATYSGNRSVEISQAITKELEAALKGAKSAEQALGDAASAANKLIGVK